MAKQKYKFERLTPIDNMDLDVYEEAIDYVFSNSDVKNVAISGAYSAGKSSVLASYKKKHGELRFLHISLAHFKSTDQESDAEVKESTLEGKILNQLIHQIPSEKIPQTNFRVKKTVSSKSIATSTIGAVLFLISILHLLFFSVWKNYIGVLPVSLIKSILMPSTHPYALIVDGIIILVLLSLSVYKLIRIQREKNIFRKLNIKGNEIEIFEKSDDSYFDKYLNEVLYLFENADADVIVFEDMDRFNTNLLNQSAFLLGVPGSGKSFSAKELIAFLILDTTDDVLICDPENEFGALAAALGKETATVIHMAAGGKDRLNAMYMVDGYGENNPIVEKSQFIMSLVEQIDKAGVGPQQKSIIDRCTALVYQDAERTGKPAALCDLRNKLLEQPEEKAKEIALSLELFTTGSLDIFGHESTVDLDKRIVVFDIHGLGEQLKPTGLLVITDTILNRVTLNWKKGKRTHIFIDEFHVVFENEQSGIFFNSAWRQFRKRNGYPTAITQNVEYLLDSVQASTMLSNSEFVVMLNQAFSDRAKLSKLLNISDEQMSYVTNADAGCGLIKYGSALVPFINRFPKDTELYRLMTTRPGEGVFGSGNAS